MSDAGLVITALFGMLLTAGAMFRDTRQRLSQLRAASRTDGRMTGPS